MKFLIVCGLTALALTFASVNGDGDCEVCVGFLTKFYDSIGQDASDMEKTEEKLMSYCKKVKGRDESFCYYIGALETSATRIINSVTKPLSFGKPIEKICKELGRKDSEICALKYEKKIDLTDVDLTKLRVKELKKILNSWGEVCRGCAEKRDFIDKINQVKTSHIEL